MYIGIVASLLAGLCFAGGGVLQQRVASTRPSDESLSPRLIADLARQRIWLAGIGLAVLSYVFQATALHYAPLAVVQPLIVTEVLFAIPISVRLHRMALGRREWFGVVAVTGGLAASIAAAAPKQGNPIVAPSSWAYVLGIVAVIVSVALLVRNRVEGPWRASLIAAAGAVTMGVESGLMAAATKRFSSGLVAGFTAWEPYAMAVMSIVGLLLIQSAFQAGPLASSMPVVDAIEPVVAIGIGLALFGETIRTSALPLTVTVAGLAALLVGVVVLDTSPVVHALQKREEEQAEQTGGGEDVSLEVAQGRR